MQCTDAGQNTDVLFRFLVQSTKDRAIFGIDLQGHIISWNSGAEHIKGWRADEVLGQHFRMLFPEDYRRQGRPEAELREAFQTGHFQGEEPRLRKDGSLFIAEVDLWLLRNDADHPCGFVKVTQDVTARKQAEEALRQSEARLSAILASLDEGVTLHDVHGTIRFANAAAEEKLGLSANHLMGRTPFDPRWGAIREDGSPYPGEEHPHMRALRTGESVTGDVVGIQQEGGGRIWLSVNARPLRTADGRIAGAVSSFFDMSRRKQEEEERAALLARERAAHAEAKAERQKLYAIFELAPVGIAIFRGAHHVVQYANPVQCQFWERRSEEVLGRPFIELLPEELGPSIIATTCDPVFQKGESRVFTEERFQFTRRSTGERVEHYFNFTHVPMRDQDGTVEGFMAVAWDATDAVRAHQRAAVLTQQLQDRVDFEQQLIGIVSHDLRTPLNAIHLTVGAMARRDELDARTAQSVLRIQSAVHRASRLVGDLLDFTQARLGGGIPIAPRAANLHQVARQVLDQVDAANPGRTLRVQEQGDATGEWDPERLAQVVQNLVTNALKYSPESSPVQVTTRGERDWVGLSVHNQGTPIPPEKLPGIFEPLQRATSEVDSSGRSVGLGLYIVKQLVEAHGGTVDVTSTLKDGTTFNVRLPRGRPAPTGSRGQ
ncbi:sensor histidine kinase [Corallococcus aberystwythensis]|uniref:histidine kinase n=1 Tax=Corallococcus aberystwythensis TaxID=2316722 RepID=A0A3A8QFA5_9BACT|nr:PAS domain-containing sensor histidine kinase [Corallococcus aberystwythensis]RKH67347.1 PAS domain-containing sensor histidine kinase [Corallococcus aberystwythensis]